MGADVRRRGRVRRLCVTVSLAFAAVAGLSVGAAWANPDPPAQPAPANETPAQPPADEAPAAPRAPAGEPFLPPGEWTDTPPAAPADPANPAPSSEAPGSPTGSPTPIDANAPAVAASGSSTSGTSRAGGGGLAVATAGAAAAGGLFRRRPDESKDDYTRRMAGAGMWGAAGTVILIAKGITLVGVLGGGGCLVVAVGFLWWGAPGRVRAQPAPAGPAVPLGAHLDAAQDHNLELNQSGVRIQSQVKANPVDDQ